MGSKKTLERVCITAHFFCPGRHFDVREYCATYPQCQVVVRKLKSSGAPFKSMDTLPSSLRRSP